MKLTPSRSNTIALLAACSMFLSAFEYIIPKPVPFFRIGLANLPILFGVAFLTLPELLLLVFLKVFIQGLIYGSLFSYVIVLSAGGTFSSSIIMFLMYRLGKKHFSFAGISTAGAFISNSMQLILAGFFIFSQSIWLIAPPFYVIGGISGLLLGLFANGFYASSEWLKQTASPIIDQDTPDMIMKERPGHGIQQADAKYLLLHGLLILPAFLLQTNLLFRIIQTLLFFTIALMMRKKRILVFSIVSFFCIMLFSLFIPFGEVIFKIAAFPVTKGALETGVFKSTTFLGLIALSAVTVTENLRFRGFLGRLTGKVFFYFERLKQAKTKYDTPDIFKRIDLMLMDVSKEIDQQNDKEEIRFPRNRKRHYAGIVLCGLSVLLHWGLYVASFFIKNRY